MTIIPLELVENILDHSAGDTRCLKNCSLVSRAWVSRCRIHLFGECALWPSRIAAFCDLLRSPECTFLPHVGNIHSLVHYGPGDYAIYDKIAEDLGRLINVRELEMTVMAPYSLEKFHTFLRTSFPTITRFILDLRNSENPGSTLLANIICLFPALQEVNIATTAVLEGIPCGVVPPRGLCSLAFCRNSAGQMLSWMDAADQLSNVDSLTLPSLRGPDIPTVYKVLQQSGNKLYHLYLTLPGGLEGVETLQMIDLSLHQSLQTLCIRDLSAHSDTQETILWIPGLIMQLRTPALERLTLVLSLCWPPYEMVDWTAIDGFLSPVRFPCLRSVVLKCEYHGDKFFYTHGRKLDTHEFVRKALPMLADSGVLRTEW
ncbi:hypothetical protein C8R45DRAFT_431206 [Mycena sanguinolenta]|nr:hypothetical protein C8R45DRAFT_431206 [Mycena sanguinolenta]